MGKGRFDHVLVAVAGEDDATATAAALARNLDADRVTVVHVVEKAGGAPDKAGVEQSETAAEASFAAFREGYHGGEVTTRVVFDTDVADGLVRAAREADADAVVFTPRGGSWFERALTGNVARDLMDAADRPVVAIPDAGTGADA
ncbi:universal stress protein [Halosegnis marinus]|uniref:Universal stress protein n=1 Tax=Halosegnis marinus TaxID=3034023 RepID=A0ABD5ZL32_9EURY|nr:universal stress protein [Halosegnis sp. DT85]